MFEGGRMLFVRMIPEVSLSRKRGSYRCVPAGDDQLVLFFKERIPEEYH